MNRRRCFVGGDNQCGTAMIEFAIVLPVLVILLFGFVEIGRALYQENMLTKAVATGARYIARVPDAVTSDCRPGAGWAAACAVANALITHADAGAGATLLPGLDETDAVTFSTRADSVSGETVCVIRANAQVKFAAIFGDSVVPLLNLGAIPLTAQAEERFIGE